MHDHHQQERPQRPFEQSRQHFKILVALCQIISSPVEAWLHRPGSWGELYAGFHMMAGWVFIPVFWALFCPHMPPGPIMLFWIATSLLLVIHRIRGAWLRRKGVQEHSRYSGRPWLPGKERSVKSTWEPFLVATLGFLACGWNPGLGAYLVVSGLCLSFSVGFQEDVEKARLRQMRDAQLEQAYYLSRFREEGMNE